MKYLLLIAIGLTSCVSTSTYNKRTAELAKVMEERNQLVKEQREMLQDMRDLMNECRGTIGDLTKGCISKKAEVINDMEIRWGEVRFQLEMCLLDADLGACRTLADWFGLEYEMPE